MKVTVHLFMSEEYKEDFSGKHWVPDLWRLEVSENERRIYVGPREIEIDVPEDFDPTARQIAALEREREAIRAKFTADIAAVNERISKLQALTYEVPA